MAITRERKEELVALYGDLLKNTNGFIVAEYKSMSVKQMNDVRAKLRDVNGRFIITKNTLFSIALRGQEWPVPEDLLLGPVAIVMGDGNFPAVAKSFLGMLKDYEGVLTVKGGVMTPGIVLNPAQVEAVSSLPSLEELRAQLAGLIVQPAAGLVSVLNAGVASVAQVLQAYVSKQESEAA